MSATGNVLPSPTEQLTPFQKKQLRISILSVTIAVIAVLTRGDFYHAVSVVFRWFETLLNALFHGMPVVPKRVEPHYDPILAGILHAVQAATIFSFAAIQWSWFRKKEKELPDAKPVAKQTFQQFERGWMSMWGGWLALYFGFF